jgi:cytochrome c556
MKNYLIVLAAAALLLGALSVCPSRGQEQKPSEQEKASVWMKKKLEFSQNILAGLTESDFDKVRANAEAMRFLGYLEKWARADRPDYKKQVVFFDFANQELIRQAKEKNLDGATLAYNQLTVSCVQCHKIVRGAKK